jgi:all-trans-retinol 13,14-reductase
MSIKEKDHVVIIGRGIGGLTCALILLKEGFRVTILEKNRQFGGNLQVFVRDKCIFDTGVHYIGGMEEGQNLYTIFKYLGIVDDLNLRKCNEDGYDLITFGGDSNKYWHAQGYDNFVRVLTKSFPQEELGIRKYVDKMKSVSEEFPVYYLKPTDGGVVDSESLHSSAKDFIESCTENEKLRNVLAGTNALYAGPGDKTPLYVHALIINSYLESAYKCVDGGAQIEKEISKKIKYFGGEMLKYKNVIKFVCDDNGKVEYALTDEGEKFYGDRFISNIHPVNTIEMLEGSKIRPAYRNRINSLENTISTFILNIVLEEDSFKYQNFNHYHHVNDDVWDSIDNYNPEHWPAEFALFCPPNSKSEEYGDCLTVMAYMHMDEMDAWKDTLHTIPHHKNDRGETYQDFKNRKSELLIDLIETKYPGIKSKIKSTYASTPLTYRDYIGTKDGSMYGIIKDHKDPLKSFIPPRTKVPNLLLTGQNLNMHGVLGVAISSLVTCGQLIEMNDLLDKINEC